MINATNLLRSVSGRLPAGTRRWAIPSAFIAISLALALALFGGNMIRTGGTAGGNHGAAATAASRVGSEIAAKLRGAGSDLLAMLGLRSPGQRSRGELADTKGRRLRPMSHLAPHQRALAKVRPPRNILRAFVPEVPATVDTIPGLAVAPADVGAPIVTDLLPPVGPPPGGLIFGGGGGGGGGGLIGSVPPSVIPPVPSAVPEPSTWALMLLGFGAIGGSLRRARRREAKLERAVKAIVAGR
jgi:hypothetical protein